MAQTIAEIEGIIDDAIAAEAPLGALTSTSKTAIWRLWKKVTAHSHQRQQQQWDVKERELLAKAQSIIAGPEKWYAERALEFQYGYSLTEVDGKLVYLVDDPAKRIITKVSVPPGNIPVLIKVAKGTAALEKLTVDEKISFISYMNTVKFAGTDTTIVSQDPDLIKIQGMKIYYDGMLILADFKATIEAAIDTFLKGIFFDGIFGLNAFRDAIEKVPGTKGGPDIPSVEIKPDAGVYTYVSREYNPVSGWFKIDPAFPLSDPSVIEYIAK